MGSGISSDCMTEYIELHCHSNFSLLDGASHPEALVERAAALGMPALALTDHDAVYGAIRFTRAAQAAGIQPILGLEITLEDGVHLTLLVEDSAGWENLCTLISLARANAPKGDAALPYEALEGHTAGLIALSGCRRGEVPSALLKGRKTAALAMAERYQRLFGPDRYWIELQRHLLPQEESLTTLLVELASRIGSGIVATNNVHYATRDGQRLQEILCSIREGRSLETATTLRPNSEYYLKGYPQMAPLFVRWPEALSNTLHIVERCQFEMQYGLQDLPVFPAPEGMNTAGYLRSLCLEALPRRYGDAASEVLARLDYELAVIERGSLSNYFLIVADIVQFARRSNIRCQGRGSAANSLVAYLLNISPIDPLVHNLVFERFLSDERSLPPDIDIDFDAAPDRREAVIQYVYERYGHQHAAMACTFVTFRARSAIRDVGKALGFPLDVIDKAAKHLDTYNASNLGEYIEGETEAWQQLFDLCNQINHFPRHLGIHNGGMIITGSPLAQRIPIEPATMRGRVVVQWDKDALEEAGMVKIDLLGLRMLSAISDTLALIEETTGEYIDLDRLTFDDPAVFEMISEADTIGIFQVESRAQAQMLPRFQPVCFNDLIIAISLIRPGPIMGNMVHPYLRRRLGEEEVSYFHPHLVPALEETLGVILFQEQVLKVARDLAGFTSGQGELLRRALGSKYASELLEQLRSAFLEGALQNEVPLETAVEVFEKLQSFGSYSFPKSHAAAFAVLVYQSAWLKRYFCAHFMCSILNHQPMGFWSPAVVLNDMKRHEISVLPVSVNYSSAKCTVENNALRPGLLYVNGLGEEGSRRIVEARKAAAFSGMDNFCRDTRLPRSIVERLILAGALDDFDLDRRQLIWKLNGIRYREEELPLEMPQTALSLEPFSHVEAFGYQYGVLGVNVSEHPMAFYRDQLSLQGILSSGGISIKQNGDRIRVAGLVVMHQAPPTAKGVHFVTLEDEAGFANIIFSPNVYGQYRNIIRGNPMLIIDGEVQRKGQVINVSALKAVALP
jgi:error-prone DNA polymerase